ncbi:MAG: UDP-N-acetylmuramate dehydrogenase [Oscillospiraceae bacterium]|nr:UDP-N-acetylmuramate dehydrogenase [Clostridiaceae bacterium]MDY5889737.1 UDP-N-acetylmuramate dehydrogenase [Oscillospiraceae bacterium]MDY5934581.1 UDP-N-acetylmuramate dehydrogenase [Oscillospiraceae bacterium]
MSFDKIYDYAKSIGCPSQRDVPMSKYTTFRIGGNASVMLTPTTDEQLASIIKKCKEDNIKPFIIGNGSNMLISDKGLDTVVINMCRPDPKIELVNGDTVVCDAGATMSRVCNFALENGLTGLEFAFGIPGSAGGAAYMNAGAYGGEMKDVLVECRHIDSDGNFGSLKGEELGLAYRTSAYEHNGYIITTLVMKLSKGNKDEIRAKMQELLQRRKDKQPLEYPSAGSTFKRPEGYFAGALIEECGLKGYSVGGAQVSEKHAGFVINKGDASAKDVLDLIKYIQDKVLSEKGVMLEPEVRLIEE